MKLLTISIAAYNVEAYLEKTLESIVDAGKNDEIEVFVVNDGSKDRTAEIARTYEDKYPGTIHLIDKENGGHGSTINKGMEKATGKYFRALDGDDWVNSNNLRSLIEQLPTINADIILSDYCKCYEDGRNEIIEFDGIEKGKEYSFEDISNRIDWMRYHTVIYKTDILRQSNTRLDEHCFYVDTEFMLLPIPLVKTVYYAKDFIYCYRLGLTDQSVSPESRKKHINNSLTVANRLLAFYETESYSIDMSKRAYIINGLTNHCMWHYKSLLMFAPSRRKLRELIDFDRKIKKHCPEAYLKLEQRGRESRLIILLRRSRYLLYPLISEYKSRQV